MENEPALTSFKFLIHGIRGSRKNIDISCLLPCTGEVIINQHMKIINQKYLFVLYE